MLEIASLCKTEGFINESVYFFSMTLSKPHSLAQELIIFENLGQLYYYKGELEKAVQYYGFLKGCNYKQSKILEIYEHLTLYKQKLDDIDIFDENANADERSLITANGENVKNLIASKERAI